MIVRQCALDHNGFSLQMFIYDVIALKTADSRNSCFQPHLQLPTCLYCIKSLKYLITNTFFLQICKKKGSKFSCQLTFNLLLLMSGNVHSNLGPVFPCSVCTGNVTWQGKSVQCCTCFKWVHLRCSQPSLSKFRALDSSHSWSCPPVVSPLITL